MIDEGLVLSFLMVLFIVFVVLGFMCNYNMCDSKILYLMYDKRCLIEGG